MPVSKLAKMFNLSDESVRTYIHKYNSSGLEGLIPKSPPGRRGKITPTLANPTGLEFLSKTPNQYKKLQTDSRQWTLELIRVYLKAYHEISVTPAAIHLALRRVGYRTGRSKLRVGSPDPEYQAKRTQLTELTSLQKTGELTSEATRLILPDTQLRRLGFLAPETENKTARLFFFDEANVSWCPNSGRIYRQQGTEYKVNTPGKNQRKYLIGSLEYPSGGRLV